jgi:hypothetical protein
MGPTALAALDLKFQFAPSCFSQPSDFTYQNYMQLSTEGPQLTSSAAYKYNLPFTEVLLLSKLPSSDERFGTA